MKNNFTLICLFLYALLFTVNSKAQVISQLSFYSPLINTFDMKYTDDHLVVSQNGLLIFDVSDPAKKPQLVAQTSYPGSTARAIGVQNNYAYMAFGNNGIFAVYDISSFSSPVLKGSVAIPAASFYIYGDVEPHGNYVYLSGFDSLYVVDVSNPLFPSIANALPVAHNDFNGAENMAIEGSSLFIKTPLSIQVYDITDAANPSLISSINYLHAYNNEIAADTVNHRIFLSWATVLKDFTGYDAYDVSNPAAPKFLFSDSTEFSSGDFGIIDYSYFNNVVFVSRGGSINAFDVTSAAQHGFVTNFSGEDIPNASVSIQTRDSVFFHSRGGGIEVLKYSNSPVIPCETPTGLKQKVIGTTGYLYWAKKQSSIGYTMRYRQLGTNKWNYVPTKDNVQKIKNLQPGAYTWEVKSFCGLSLKESSDWSLYNIFYVEGNDLIAISPNPASSYIHVRTNNTAITQFIITDLTGRPLIKTRSSGAGNDILIASLKTGSYILQALDKSNRVITTTKIFRQ